jgi:DNA-binding CsgD family transcriptional regulator/PAS domain-containing protein
MDVVSEETLLPLIDRIYSSVERPDLWGDTIYAVGEAIGGRRDLWSMQGSISGRGINPVGKQHTSFLSRQDLKVFEKYVDEFGELIAQFLKLVFLSLFWRQNEAGISDVTYSGIADKYLAAFQPVEGTSVSSPEIRRLVWALWTDGRRFDGDGLRRMQLLTPHLERAVRLQMRLRAVDLRARMVSGALDHLTLGVIFVDAAGVPLWLNRRAKEILNHSTALRLSSNGLAGQRPSDTKSLRQIIKETVFSGLQGILAINRDFDLRPLLLVTMPLNRLNLDGTKDVACGVLFISDPDRVDNPPIEALRQAFDLTYREAQMAIAISQGHGLPVAAETMGVAITTARSQLQQAFIKTGTRHQAELAALVHRTLSPLRHD